MLSGKSDQVKRAIIDLLYSRALKPGDYSIAENKLAEELGLSRVTVRRAYSELEEAGVLIKSKGRRSQISDRVFSAIDEMPDLLRQPHRRIGVILPDPENYFATAVDFMRREAVKYHFELFVYENPDRTAEDITVEKVLKENFDGFIITPLRYSKSLSASNYQKLMEQERPLVMIGKAPAPIFCDCVYGEDVSGAYEITLELIRANCERLIYVHNRLLDRESLIERNQGFNLAVGRMKRMYLFTHEVLDVTDPDFEEKFTLSVKSAKKAGILLYDDLMAPGIYDLIKRIGGRTIGGDVCVSGYNNNVECGTYEVPLTSVGLDRTLLGRESLRLLNNAFVQKMGFTRGILSNHVTLKPNIVYRQSFCRNEIK